eukprot:4252382-Amphidinium_carterae.1
MRVKMDGVNCIEPIAGSYRINQSTACAKFTSVTCVATKPCPFATSCAEDEAASAAFCIAFGLGADWSATASRLVTSHSLTAFKALHNWPSREMLASERCTCLYKSCPPPSHKLGSVVARSSPTTPLRHKHAFGSSPPSFAAFANSRCFSSREQTLQKSAALYTLTQLQGLSDGCPDNPLQTSLKRFSGKVIPQPYPMMLQSQQRSMYSNGLAGLSFRTRCIMLCTCDTTRYG